MLFRFTPIASAAAALAALSSAPSAQAQSLQPSVTVSATRIEMQDIEAPYASEVHTRQDIAQSGAHSLFDYLAQHSSLHVTPSYGNRYTPQISMRGYGEEGNQNLVISLNGRRLNNIDNIPQLIGAINLADVERIEITKGSGSVLYGDGATAGTIQIYTRAQSGASVDAFAGNYGQRGTSASVGLVQERLELSASANADRHGGFSAPAPDGHRDASKADTWQVAATARPVEALRLHAALGDTRIDTRYPSPLSAQMFAQDPGANNGSSYTHQEFQTQHWNLAADYTLSPQLQLSAKHHNERKSSRYLPTATPSDYHYVSNELSLQHKRGAVLLNTGVQHFDGERNDTNGSTRKDSLGGFVQAQYMQEHTTWSAGVRREQVQFKHRSAASQLAQQHLQHAWELGINHRLTPQWTGFANYSDAFNTPHIDHFFDLRSSAPRFNDFIAPARSRTLTLGANYQTERTRWKLSGFYSRLHNEIYYDPDSGKNTNIDQSHKYGLELQQQLQLSPRVQTSVNYAWTRARIDREVEGAANYAGKDLPGVPDHSLILGLNLRMGQRSYLHLSHTWRSSAWAYANFANDPAFRQPTYQSTDVAYRYQLNSAVEVYASITNLLDRKNGVALRTGKQQLALYPSNFERSWKVGARLNF